MPEPSGNDTEPLPDLPPDPAADEQDATAPGRHRARRRGSRCSRSWSSGLWPWPSRPRQRGGCCGADAGSTSSATVGRAPRGPAGRRCSPEIPADRGVPIQPSDTVEGAARRIVRDHRLDVDAQQALRRLVGAVEASFYGGAEIGDERLAEDVRLGAHRNRDGEPAANARPRAAPFGPGSGAPADGRRGLTRTKVPRNNAERPADQGADVTRSTTDACALVSGLFPGRSLLLEPAAEPLLHATGEPVLVRVRPWPGPAPT